MIDINQNVFIYKDNKLLIQKHNTFQGDGISLIYNLLSGKDTQGIKYIEFLNGSELVLRQALNPQQFTISNNVLQLSYQLPIPQSLQFDRMRLFGGTLQTDTVGSGYEVQEIQYDKIIEKLPYSIETIFWEIIININE